MAYVQNDHTPWIPDDTFGARLALIRQHFGWNIKEAALACGIVPQSWRNWEQGRTPNGLDAVARKIADQTGCDYLWLLAGEDAAIRSRCSPMLSLVRDVGQMILPFPTGLRPEAVK